MATATQRRRTYLEHDERRAQILAVAARLFSQRTYDAVSTAEIAREAGIARGLINHYFTTKRGLYVEVVRWMLRVPDDLLAVPSADGVPREQALRTAIDRWLDSARANRLTWAAVTGAQGFGRDPEIEAALEASLHEISERLIALAWGDPAKAPPELWALMRGYRGFAEAVTLDWLERRKLSRAQVHEILYRTVLALAGDVLDDVHDHQTATKTARRRTR